MKYRIVAIDLDGTLLSPRGTVHDQDATAIGDLRRLGVTVLPCTGRSLSEAAGTLRTIGHEGLCIFIDGAHTYDWTNGRTIHTTYVDSAEVQSFVEVLKALGGPVLALSEQPATAVDYVIVGEEWLPKVVNGWFDQLGVVRTLDTGLLGRGVLRIGTILPLGRVVDVRQALAKRLGTDTATRLAVQTLPVGGGTFQTLELLPAATGKWNAICRVANLIGVEYHEIAAIGDSHNDTEMVHKAGCGIAMGNACAETSLVAKWKTTCNHENGVAFALTRLLEGTW